MNPTKISTRTVNANVIILGFKYIGKTVDLFYKPTRSYQFILNHSSIVSIPNNTSDSKCKKMTVEGIWALVVCKQSILYNHTMDAMYKLKKKK